MAHTLTCSQGHRWQAADDAATLFCPVCGAASLAATGGFAPDGLPATLPGPPPSRPSAAPPTVPGYEMLGELGRGGMSIVYKARHLKLNRIVALKMLTAGAFAGPDLLARFQREGESLARLTHPNIVQIHEVGWIEPQGPFLTLEYVDGGSLAQKLAGTPQPPRKAAETVAILAQAVHFAHQRGILHRDLKPANVMLTADGVPKVTDFGLARFLQLEAGSGSDSPTPTGAVLGTPSYMAPEQASGVTRAPTAAIDVYALGAVLYEMLTGRPPFLAEGPLETTLMVITDDPVPPRRLQANVPRDLETICLHCLRKNPRQRYATAAALADDLQRFLDGRPIQVRPAGPVERLAKWARRRPAAAALLAVSTLAVLAGIGLAAWYQVQLHEKNVHLTQANNDLTDKKNQYDKLLVVAVDTMTEYGEAADDAVAVLPNSEQARRQLLEKRLQFFGPFQKLSSDDPRLLRRKARATVEIAKIHQKLGDLRTSEQEFNNAIDLYEKGTADPDAGADLRGGLARCCVDLGGLLHNLHREADAEKQFERGAELLQATIDDGSGGLEARENLAACYHNLASTIADEAHWDEALDAIGKAEKIHKELWDDDPGEGRYQVEVAEDHAQRSDFFRRQGDYKRGLAEAETALQMIARAAPGQSGQEKYRHSLLTAHISRAMLLTAGGGEGDLAAARPEFDEARRLGEGLAKEHPDVPLYRHQTAYARHFIGRIDMLARKWTASEAAFREAADLYQGLPAEWQGYPDVRTEGQRNLYYLADALHAQGKEDEAEKIMRDLIERSPQDPHLEQELGEILCAQGEAAFRRGVVMAGLPPIGLTVMPNPLGMGLGYNGQQLSARTLGEEAIRRSRESVERLRTALRVGGPEWRRQRQIMLTYTWERAAKTIVIASGMLADRESLRSGAEAQAELAELWLTTDRPAAATEFRRAAGGVCSCLYLARADLTLSPDKRDAEELDDGERIVQILQRAVAAGFHDPKELKASFEAKMILDESIACLKKPRQEFKKLLAELENPGPP